MRSVSILPSAKKIGSDRMREEPWMRIAGKTTSSTVTSVKRLLAVPVDPSCISVSEVHPDSHLFC